MTDEFRRGQIAIAALFGFLGFQYGTWASRLPLLQSRLDLSPAEVGLLLLAPGIGAAGSFPVVARLMRRYGSRRLAEVSAVALIAVLAALAVVTSYPVAIVVLLADGVAVACLNVAMNTQGAALEARFARTTMAKLHAVFSAGTFAAALLASLMTTLSPALAVHFAVAGALLLTLIALSRTGTLRADLAPEAKARSRWALPTGITAVLGLAMVFGTVVEGAMNDWSALYLRDVAHAAEALTPLGIAVFAGMMVLARLFADGWRARWGDRPVVIGGSVLAGAGLTIAVATGGVPAALIGFASVGLGMAAVTPCLYVAAARLGPEALTLVAAMGTTGLLAGPPVIGFIANGAGLSWGMAAVAGSALLVAALMYAISPARVTRTGDVAAEVTT